MIEIGGVIPESRDHGYAPLVGVRGGLAERDCELCRADAFPREQCPEAHVDDVRTGAAFGNRGGGIHDAGDDTRERAAPAMQHLYADQGGTRRDSDRPEALTGSADDSCHVGAVPERVVQAADAQRVTRLIEVESPARDKRP